MQRFLFIGIDPGRANASWSIDGEFPMAYAYYQSNNCAGTPFTIGNSTTDINVFNQIFAVGPQSFYYVPNSEQPATITANSLGYWQYINGSNTFTCSPYNLAFTQQSNPLAFELHQVTLPFTTPLALPLQFKYQ